MRDQRAQQERLVDELMSPLSQQILPSSIEERINLYEKVMACEEQKIAFRLVREKFLNYRLLRAWVKNNHQEVVPSYFLFYSSFKKELIKGNMDKAGFFSKEEVRFISVETFNDFAKTSYKNVAHMLQNPPQVECEIEFRMKFLDTFFISLSPIIILDTLEIGKYEIYALAKTYHDIRENLALIR